MFQNPFGVPERTTLDHVVFPLLAQGINRASAQEQAHTILQRFHLDYASDRLFRDLSGGEAQRLMLARSMSTKPDLLLVDEPTAQLDTRTAQSVTQTLTNFAGQGFIVAVATNDPATRDACPQVIDLSQFAPPPARRQTSRT